MKKGSLVLTLMSCILGPPALAQSVDMKAGAKAQSETDVRVAPDGTVSVKSKAKAEAETSVSVGADPQRPAPRPKPPQQPAPASMLMPPPPPPDVIYVDPLPPVGVMADPAAPPPKPRPPLPCKKTIEALSGDLRVTIINNYCTVKITIRQIWREGGKTRVEFEADNAKGGQQAHLKLVEQWMDRSGRAVADAIDEQKIAIGKGRNVIFSVAGPTPAAVSGTLTLYK